MAENKDGQEKTEQATSKRLLEARNRGQVSKSMDTTTAAVLLFGGMVVFLFGSNTVGNLQKFWKTIFQNSAQIQITDQNFIGLFTQFMSFAASLILPVILLIFAVALFAEISQVGLHWATKKFTEGVDFKKVFWPVSGLKRIFFSGKSLFELAKSIFKIGVLGLIVYQVLSSYSDEAVSLIELPYIEIGEFVAKVSLELLLKLSVAYILLAIADYYYQKYRFAEDMKMTKQEIKDETKQTLGDPKVKQRLRSIMMSKFRSFMLKNVKTADVVITNPTHYAVALSYKPDSMNAPTVVAKGVDYLAQKIRETAKENNIPIIQDPPLTRLIYKSVEVNDEIPENLFKAVAQILAFVYHIKHQPKQKISI